MSDSVRECIDAGGVVMDPAWLREASATIGWVRQMLAELARAQGLASSQDVREAVVMQTNRTLAVIQDALFEAANDPPVRDLARVQP